jgi:serine/threonine protein kinase
MAVMSDAAGVVQLYGSFEDERHVSLVMEHCTAGDLFKTMLVHGGVLDEHWVAIQVSGSLSLGPQDVSPHDVTRVQPPSDLVA